MTVDLRWGIDAVPERMELVVSTGMIEAIIPAGERTLGVTVTADFELHDDRRRLTTLGDALGPTGIPAAPSLVEWVEVTRQVSPQAQTWQTDLAWWDGAWELWIDPDYQDGNATGPLRVLFDASRREVVDVRAVPSGNGGSSDDADAPEGVRPDDVRYQAD